MSNITSPRARQIVRAWARTAGQPINDKGAIPEQVRQAYVNAHAPSKEAHIVETTTKSTKVMCPYCANIHTHGAGSTGPKIAHCSKPLTDTDGGYWIVEARSA